MFFGIDPVYFIFVGPGILFSLWASFYVKHTFAKYSAIPARSGMSGAEAAARLLQCAGVTGVSIERADGFLGDHYNPATRTLKLSNEVYDRATLSAIGVACHEAGHAIQHAERYAALGLRSSLVPLCNIGGILSWIIIMAGFLMHNNPQLILLGAAIFSVTVLFALVTLPVEWNASTRARLLMVRAGIVSPTESEDAWRVLRAAFMTYVAAAVAAVLTLLYYLFRAGVFGGRSDD
jgi:Zn-dependent membrane protease YugP